MTMYDDNRVVTLLRDIDPPLAPPDRLHEVTRRARRGESRRASALAGVMAVVLVAGVVSAINLGHRGNTEVLTVAGAADATAAARTARVTMEISLTGADAAALGPRGKYILSGPVDFEHERYSLKGRLAGTDYEMRGIGKDQWTTRLSLALGIGSVPGKKWLHLGDAEHGDGIGQLDPSSLFRVLIRRGHELSRKIVGDRTVFVLQVPADVLEPTAEAGAADDVVTVEVDSHDRIRTLSTKPEASGDGTVSFKLSYDDFGIDVNVQPPPKEEVAELSDLSQQSGSSQQFTVGSLGTMTPEACATLTKKRDELVNQAPAEQKAEIAKAFDQAMAGCAQNAKK